MYLNNINNHLVKSVLVFEDEFNFASITGKDSYIVN